MSTSTTPAPASSSRSPGPVPAPRQHWSLLGPWPAHWPLTVLFVGYPLWWALGVSAIMPAIMAIPMALQLLRRHPVRMPFGFSWWLVLMLWMVAGIAVLFVDAPSAVPGGGTSRLLVFVFRLMWYAVITVVALWILNLDEGELPSRHVVRLMAWMFVVTAVGGLAGVVWPSLEFTSPLELLLPQTLRENNFISSLVHPATSYIQSVLGFEAPRPIAPFSFANAWGANLSMFLPFFLVGWLARDAGWRRLAAPVVLAVAAVPIVMSLNRGLWVSIAVGAVYVVVRLVMSGKLAAVIGVLAVLVIAATLFMVSPLGELATSRLENPHSNGRRGELLTLTVTSTAEGSPVVGFGSTRDVKGSFASIAGGGTPDCKGCEVPPLGTQGYLWMVIFSQGFVGAVAMLGYFGTQLVRHWPGRTTLQAIGITCLLFFFLQMFIYDNLGLPMYSLMIAIGLMERERRRSSFGHGPTLEAVADLVRRNLRLLVSLSVLGALVGTVFALSRPTVHAGTVSVLLAPAPLYLDPGSDAAPRQITVDTEAGMVYSERTVQQVLRALDLESAQELRDSIEVTAPENTRVLDITVRDTDADRARSIADRLAEAYLDVRSDYLAQRRQQLRQQLERQLELAEGSGETVPTEGSVGRPQLLEDRLTEQLSDVNLYSSVAGEVLRPATAARVRHQAEVPVVTGAMSGLLIGLGVASWRGAVRRRKVMAQASTRASGPRPRAGRR